MSQDTITVTPEANVNIQALQKSMEAVEVVSQDIYLEKNQSDVLQNCKSYESGNVEDSESHLKLFQTSAETSGKRYEESLGVSIDKNSWICDSYGIGGVCFCLSWVQLEPLLNCWG